MQLELQKAKVGKAQAMCSYCYSPDHLFTDCHMQPPRAEEANFVNAGWRRPEQQFNQVYNQNQRQHPGFQWSNPQGGQYAPTAPYQPPHMRQNQFQAQLRLPQHQRRLSRICFLQLWLKWIDKQSTMIKNLAIFNKQ